MVLLILGNPHIGIFEYTGLGVGIAGLVLSMACAECEETRWLRTLPAGPKGGASMV